MGLRLGSVQDFASPRDWPADAIYIGMPGKAARAHGIPDRAVGPFGKPWACRDDARGWAAAYTAYLYDRLLHDADFRAQVKALDGHLLLCWCTAKERRRGTPVACHGRLLAEAVRMLRDR